MEKMASDRVTWVENLRAVATIAVVLIHVSAPLVSGALGTSASSVSIFCDAAARFCVPIFVMLTGALLLDRELPLNVFFAKRFRRVFVPFAAWTGVYLAYHFVVAWQSNGISSPFLVAQFLAQKLLRGADYHLWYIYMLVGLYLLLPLLSKALRAFSETDLRYFLAIWVVGLFAQPILDRFHSPFDIRYFTGYAGYLVLGYYLKTQRHRLLESARLGWILYLVGTAITFVGTVVLSTHMGQFSGFFYGYLTPNTAIQAVGVFLIVKNTAFQSSWFQQLDADSYGIYLSHVLVLRLLEPVSVQVGLPMLFIPMMTVLCLVFSWALIRALKMSPPLRKFVG